MPWYGYAILTAIFLSFFFLVEKKVLTKVHSLTFSTTYSLLTFIFTLPLVFFMNFKNINQQTLILMLITAAFSAAAIRFTAKGMRHLQISTVSPLMALNPGAAALTGLIFLGEHLKFINLAGLGCMVIGSYVLAISPDMKIIQSIKKFFSSKYVFFSLLAVFFYALSATVDRTLMGNYKLDPFAYMFFVNLFTACIFLVVSIQWGKGLKGISEALRIDGDKITVLSLLTLAYNYPELKALGMAYVGLVSAIKRMSTLFATIIGGEIFHEDKLLRKTIASIIIIIGGVLIVL